MSSTGIRPCDWCGHPAAVTMIRELPSHQCRVTFRRTVGVADGHEFDVYLNIVPKSLFADWKDKPVQLCLTATERVQAYEAAAKLIGDEALSDYCIASAAMVGVGYSANDDKENGTNPVGKVTHECPHCMTMTSDELLARKLTVAIPSGKLFVTNNLDPDYPGVDISYVANGMLKPVKIASIEEYLTPVQHGMDTPEEYSVPASRQGTAFCEIDRTDVSVITPGLMCRVWPKIYSETDESTNIAYDHVDYDGMRSASIREACKDHNEWLDNHPKRKDLLQLFSDNEIDADDAVAMTDAILDLFASKGEEAF